MMRKMINTFVGCLSFVLSYEVIVSVIYLIFISIALFLVSILEKIGFPQTRLNMIGEDLVFGIAPAISALLIVLVMKIVYKFFELNKVTFILSMIFMIIENLLSIINLVSSRNVFDFETAIMAFGSFILCGIITRLLWWKYVKKEEKENE